MVKQTRTGEGRKSGIQAWDKREKRAALSQCHAGLYSLIFMYLDATLTLVPLSQTLYSRDSGTSFPVSIKAIDYNRQEVGNSDSRTSPRTQIGTQMDSGLTGRTYRGLLDDSVR
jgi:hypothetical protein